MKKLNSLSRKDPVSDSQTDAIISIVSLDDKTKKIRISSFLESILSSLPSKGKSIEKKINSMDSSYEFIAFNKKSEIGKPVFLISVSENHLDNRKSKHILDAFGQLIKKIEARSLKKVVVDFSIHNDQSYLLELLALTCTVTPFSIQNFKSKSKKKLYQPEIYLAEKMRSEFSNAFLKGLAIGDVVNYTRELVDLPPNVLTPKSFVQRTRKALPKNIRLKVFGKKQLQKERFGLMLAVSQSSPLEPQLLHLSYRPRGRDLKRICLIGKGVTYDTGGLSLKPRESMTGMKGDMAGAASCVGAIILAARLNLKVEIDVIWPLVENAIGGNSFRVDDIFTSRSGLTVEIKNTDAEGRLILADALNYSLQFKADYTVDIATLTGAALIATGKEIAPLMGNSRTLVSDLLKSADRTGELLWELPLHEGYRESLKSPIADLKNSHTRDAGTIWAGLFLQEFAPKNSWAHIDFAGPHHSDKGSNYLRPGATGFGVRLFLDWLEGMSK